MRESNGAMSPDAMLDLAVGEGKCVKCVSFPEEPSWECEKR